MCTKTCCTILNPLWCQRGHWFLASSRPQWPLLLPNKLKHHQHFSCLQGCKQRTKFAVVVFSFLSIIAQNNGNKKKSSVSQSSALHVCFDSSLLSPSPPVTARFKSILTPIDQTSTHIRLASLPPTEGWAHRSAHYNINLFYPRTTQPSVRICNPLIRLLHHSSFAAQGSSRNPRLRRNL